MASFSAEEQKASEAVEKYSKAFSGVINSIFDELPGTVNGKVYDGILKKHAEKGFVGARKPLYHVVHWILCDNRLLTYKSAFTPSCADGDRSRIRKNYFYRPEDMEKPVKKGVQKYLVTIVSRAEGDEQARELDAIMEKISEEKKQEIASLISSNGDAKAVMDALEKSHIGIDPFKSAEEQVACVSEALGYRKSKQPEIALIV